MASSLWQTTVVAGLLIENLNAPVGFGDVVGVGEAEGAGERAGEAICGLGMAEAVGDAAVRGEGLLQNAILGFFVQIFVNFLDWIFGLPANTETLAKTAPDTTSRKTIGRIEPLFCFNPNI